MFKIFNVHKDDDHHDGHTPVEVTMEDDEIIEEDVGQVALSILDCPTAIKIVSPIAGVPIEEIDVSVSRNILTISGERRRPNMYDEAERVLVDECFFGPFSRSVILPENLAFNKIRASMENNLLIIEIPKLQLGEKSIKINKFES